MMNDLVIINEQLPGQRAYIAGLNGKRIGLYAENLITAKRIAYAHFSPKKRQENYLWVELADTNQFPINLT